MDKNFPSNEASRIVKGVDRDRELSPTWSVALAALFVACSPPAGKQVFDLVEAFALAEVRTETRFIDFGTPAGRDHLGTGWSGNKRAQDGMTYAWGLGRASSLELFLIKPRDLEATLRCFPFNRAPHHSVTVVVNDREVTTLELDPAPSEYRLHLPGAALRAGSNRVVLRYGRLGDPASARRRRPAVGWDYLKIGDGIDLKVPAARTEDEPRLYLPLGSEVAFYLLTPGPSRLVVEDLALRGVDDGHLEMLWQADGAPRHQVVLDKTANLAEGVALPDAEGRPVRLSLRAVGRHRAGGGWQGAQLKRPEVRWRSSTPATPTVGRETPRSRPNVLLYLVDTLRADRLGCYGQSRPLTPHVDALAAEGVVFERAMAQTSWTKPAVASILTGLNPVDHGVHRPTDGLPRAAETLSELLAEVGYRSAAFVTNPHVSEGSGFAQGFDLFDISDDSAHELNDRVLAWLSDTRAGDGPFFLYVHTMDVHGPFDPAEPFRERFAPGIDDSVVAASRHPNARGDEMPDELARDLLRLYDAEVAQNDNAFGILLEGLRQRGLASDTIVVFVSDHGEAFQEHGVFGHGWDLYQQVLAVPLILRLPGGPRGVRVREGVQHVDLVPTLLDAVGLAGPAGLRGRSLLSLVQGLDRDELPAIYSYMVKRKREGISVVWGEWKLVEPLEASFAQQRELFRPWQDLLEERDLSGRYPVLSGYLASLARGELLRRGEGLVADEVVLDAATRYTLKALGYLQ